MAHHEPSVKRCRLPCAIEVRPVRRHERAFVRARVAFTSRSQPSDTSKKRIRVLEDQPAASRRCAPRPSCVMIARRFAVRRETIVIPLLSMRDDERASSQRDVSEEE